MNSESDATVTHRAEPAPDPWCSTRFTARDIGTWYWAGVEAERHRAAVGFLIGSVELDECWRPLGIQLHTASLTARLELFASCAVDFAARAGRTYREYVGGPVDWETGAPAREAVSA